MQRYIRVFDSSFLLRQTIKAAQAEGNAELVAELDRVLRTEAWRIGNRRLEALCGEDFTD